MEACGYDVGCLAVLEALLRLRECPVMNHNTLGRGLVTGLVGAGLCVAGCGRAASPSLPSPLPSPTTPSALSAPSVSRRATSPAPPARTATTGHRISSAAAIRVGSGARREVALTFDADMTPDMLQRLRSHQVRTWYNRPVTIILQQTHTPATLFLTGLWAQTYPGVARVLARDPLFEIANHSLEHKAFRACYSLPALHSDAEKKAAVSKSAAIIERVTGRRPYYFRFPGGSTDCATPADLALVAAAGEQPVDWTAAGDAFQPDPNVVVRSVLRDVRPGAIIALHLHGSAETPNAPATAQAVATLIPRLRAQGYRFVTLSQLLRG